MSKNASIIDYPREGLDKALWDTSNGLALKTDIKNQIEDVVFSAMDDLDLPEEAVKDVFIYGSILTNQYNSKTDVDCRIVLDDEIVHSKYPHVTGDNLFDAVIELVHDIPLGNTQHPLNCTIVIEGENTELGRSPLGKTRNDPVFDVLNDTIVNSPDMQSKTFDPDEEFQEEKEQATGIMQDLDQLFLETKKDVVDFEWLQDAVKGVKDKEKFLEKLNNKLAEVESDIEKIVEEYRKIKEERTKGLRTETEDSRHKAPGNIIFKFLEKYKYLDTLRKLKRLFKDGIAQDEVDDVAEVMNVSGVRRLYSDQYPPKSGRPLYIYKALKQAGYAILEMYYSPVKDIRNWRCKVQFDDTIEEYICGIYKPTGQIFIRQTLPPYGVEYIPPHKDYVVETEQTLETNPWNRISSEA